MDIAEYPVMSTAKPRKRFKRWKTLVIDSDSEEETKSVSIVEPINLGHLFFNYFAFETCLCLLKNICAKN